MAKVTITQDDGSTQDFFDQAYVDAAVAAVHGATVTEVDVIESDGTEEKFVPEA